MSGFAPDPNRMPRTRAALDARAEAERWKFTLERIASGQARDPKTEAKVALGELPIGALLTPADPDVFCKRCNNQGKDTPGPGGQNFGCPGCGYMLGEHPAQQRAAT